MTLSRYYHHTLAKIAGFYIPQGSSVLEVGSGTGDLLAALQPSAGFGIDANPAAVELARSRHPGLRFEVMNAEEPRLSQKFDYIVCSDMVAYVVDVQKMLTQLRKIAHAHTKLIITTSNYLWAPILKLGELLGLKKKSPVQNWLSPGDVENLLRLAGFDLIKREEETLLPLYVPILSWLLNRYLARLPLLRWFCMTQVFIAKPIQCVPEEYTVTVVIPAKNERGHIEPTVQRLSEFGRSIEFIFVEGGSEDGTAEEIERVLAKYQRPHIRFLHQTAKGKKNAVWESFLDAKGEVLMILDGDLTVMPEDLEKFYVAIASGRGEFINGSRLVYMLENGAMPFLNVYANKFYALAFSWILGQRLKDTLCGTKVIFKKDFEKLYANRTYFGNLDPFGDFDLIFGAAKLGLRIIDLPIRYQPRAYGKPNLKRWRSGWKLLKMCVVAANRFKFRP